MSKSIIERLTAQQKSKLLDGKSLAEEIKADLKERVAKLKDTVAKRHLDNRFLPKLAIICNGGYASEVYMRNKLNFAKEIGVKAWLKDYKDQEINWATQLDFSSNYGFNRTTYIFQEPLGSQELSDLKEYANSTLPHQDMDGIVPEVIMKLHQNKYNNKQIALPPTPAAVINLIKKAITADSKEPFTLDGKTVCVVGRSQIVGKPLALWLTNLGATVTLCHSKTKDLKSFTRTADIVVAAIGAKAKMLDKSYFSKDQIIIDVGINRDKDGSLQGDVDLLDVIDTCKYITPVPGGVGPMTVAMLFENVVSYYENILEHSISVAK